MKTNLYILFLLTILGLVSCNKNSEKIDSDSFEEFCNARPFGWYCKVNQDSFSTLAIPFSDTGHFENPLAEIKYYCKSAECSNSNPFCLLVYDISKKDTLEKLITINAGISSRFSSFYFGENEKYYIITSTYYFHNACWTENEINVLYKAIKRLFTQSIID